MSRFFRELADPRDDDAEQFTTFYEETSRDLLFFLLRRCPSAEDAADCLAEAYRIAWENRGRIPAGEEARPWLFGVARNAMRRERRSNERMVATSRELALAAQTLKTPASAEASEVVAGLADLSPLDQEIMMMLAWDGLAPRQVASVLGLSANVVRIRSHRARERLRALLAASEPDRHTGASGAPSEVTQNGS